MRDISNFNETDVREDILAPLLKSLGYASGTDHDIQREPTLRYPMMQLGRPSKNDKPISGRPDYVCTVRGVARWVLEAKAAFEDLSNEAVYQAFTYANHHEIAALFFALSNGKRFLLYRTSGGPFSEPLLDVNLDGYADAEAKIEQFLSPDSIRKFSLSEVIAGNAYTNDALELISGEAVFEKSTYEVHTPPSIRSVVEGQIRSQSQQLIGTIYPLRGGFVKHVDGVIYVEVELGAASLNDDELQKRLGINNIKFETIASEISSDPNNPTILESVKTIVAQAGQNYSSTRFPNQTVSQFDLPMKVKVDAILHKEKSQICGYFYYTVTASIPQVPGSSLSMQLYGSLKIQFR